RHKWTKERVDRLKQYARDAANAIERPRQFQTINPQLESTRNAAVSLSAMSAWAHDAAVNTFILRCDAETLLDSLKDANPKTREILERMNDMATKIATVIPITPADTQSRQAVSLEQVLQSVLHQQENRMNEKGIKIVSTLTSLPPAWANEWLVGEAINHLLQNAIRYMGSGGILSFSGHVSRDRVYIRVADTGSGIPIEVQPYLFERRMSSSDHKGGIGVGLVLTRLYLNACRGDIHLDHSNATGTTFVFHLPLAD